LQRVHVAGTFTGVTDTEYGARENVGVFSTLNVTNGTWESSAFFRGFGTGVVQSAISFVTAQGQEINFIGGTFAAAEAQQAASVAGFNRAGHTNFTAFYTPSVYAGFSAQDTQFTTTAFYTTADKDLGMVVAGRFSASGLRNIAMFENGSWYAMAGATQIEVNTMSVFGKTLLVGGPSGLAAFDLEKRARDTEIVTQSPNGAVTQILTVDDDQAVVIGSFTRVGDVDCRYICHYQLSERKWSKLGDGIDVPIRAVAASGNDLAVVGERVDIYDSSDEDWSQLGDEDALPGPADAVVIDGSTEYVIVAGRSRENNASYILYWDGAEYQPFGQGLSASSVIRQLAIVPLREPMSDSRALSPSFALLVVGTLDIEGVGKVNAALYDGEVWRPYLHTSLGTSRGELRRVVFQIPPAPPGPKRLPVPLVILIAAAIALGLIFLIVLIALLIMYILRRRRAAREAKQAEMERDVVPEIGEVMLPNTMTGSMRQRTMDGASTNAVVPPASSSTSSLPPLPPSVPSTQASSRNATSHSVQEVVEYASPQPGGQLTDLVGDPNLAASTSLAIDTSMRNRSLSDTADHSPGYSDTLDVPLETDLADELFIGMDDVDDDLAESPDIIEYSVMYAQYPFTASNENELSFKPGDTIYVLDRSDEVWWLGYIDNGPDVPPSQGVFPASYVSESPPADSAWNFF
jgi:hypothetical protein